MSDTHNTTGIITTDLSKFGFRELCILCDFIKAYKNEPLPDDWNDDNVHFYFNTYSGEVFLSNSEYQMLTIHYTSEGKILKMWYSCAECRSEGFAEDLQWNKSEDLCGNCEKRLA